MHIEERLAQYARVHLTVDLSPLNDSERTIIPLLIEAAHAMDDAFWIQIYGDPAPLLASTTDPSIRQYIQLNYGPWDALRDDEPFVAGVGAKPPGANFYPPDMTTQELEASAAVQPDLTSRYTMVRRDTHGSLADRLYGQKAAYAATILIKDQHWSHRLNRYTQRSVQVGQLLASDRLLKRAVAGSFPQPFHIAHGR